MQIFCGIDLGTTNSTVSIIRLEKRNDDPIQNLESRPIHQFDENFRYTKGLERLPSYLYFDLDNKRVYSGEYAKRMYASGDRAMQTIRSVKIRMGGDSSVEIPQIDNPNEIQYLDMVQCSGLLLKTIRQSLQEQFNHKFEDVVITVPAGFNTDQRQATVNAALLAGFKKIDILDEPTAALLYYINGGEGDLFTDDGMAAEEGMYKLVYDIGGGTLDVSLAKIIEDEDGDVEIDIIARSPRMDLGGDDFDQYLAGYFLSEFEKARQSIENRSKEEQSKIIARIVSQAEKYKIAMNEDIKQRLDRPRRLKRLKRYVDFEILHGMYIQDIPLTKDILDAILSPLVTNKIIEPIKNTLKEANVNKKQISEVLITGGMSNFYAVEEALRSFFGSEVRLIQIDWVSSVSKGAAIHNYNFKYEKLKKIKKDRMSDDIFIKVGNQFKRFLPRSTRPDESGVFEYIIPQNGLAELSVFLYSGRGNNPVEFTPLTGKFIPLSRAYHKGEKVEIKWTLDSNKIIHIVIEELDGEIRVEKDQFYSPDDIRDNFIQRLEVK